MPLRGPTCKMVLARIQFKLNSKLDPSVAIELLIDHLKLLDANLRDLYLLCESIFSLIPYFIFLYSSIQTCPGETLDMIKFYLRVL